MRGGFGRGMSFSTWGGGEICGFYLHWCYFGWIWFLGNWGKYYLSHNKLTTLTYGRIKLGSFGRMGPFGTNFSVHHHCLSHITEEQGMAAVVSNSTCHLKEGELHHQWNHIFIDNMAVIIIGNDGEKRNKWKTHHCCLLNANCKWEAVVAGSYSPCGLRIRRDGDSPNQNPIIVSYFVVVALKMRWEHSCILGNFISWIPFV